MNSSYNIVYFILTYLVPIVAMGVCYGCIGSVLWGKGIIRENACVDLAQQRKLLSKRKASLENYLGTAAVLGCCFPDHSPHH